MENLKLLKKLLIALNILVLFVTFIMHMISLMVGDNSFPLYTYPLMMGIISVCVIFVYFTSPYLEKYLED